MGIKSASSGIVSSLPPHLEKKQLLEERKEEYKPPWVGVSDPRVRGDGKETKKRTARGEKLTPSRKACKAVRMQPRPKRFRERGGKNRGGRG